MPAVHQQGGNILYLSSALQNVAGQQRAAKAKPAALLESGSEEDADVGPAGGPSLEGVLQHMVQGLNSQDGDR